MAIAITSGHTWVDGEVVTTTKLDAAVSSATISLATDKLMGRSSAGTGTVEEVSCTDAGQAIIAAASYEAQRTLLGIGTPGTLTYTATVDLAFSGTPANTVTLAGNITFTTSDLAAGRWKSVRIVGDGSSRTLAFPADWKWVGDLKLTTLSANKVARLTVESWGTTDAACIAAYAAEI